MSKSFYESQRSVPSGHLDILKILRVGQMKRGYEKPAYPGVIRGGSVGAIIGKHIIGECHRKAHLRFLGLELPLELDSEPMLRKGEAVESLIEKELKASGWELEDPASVDLGWQLNGVPGRGTMDILMKKPGEQYACYGLELKDVNSIHVMRSKHYQLKPDPKHIIQMANYALRYGDYRGLKDKRGKTIPLPYALIYSFRSIIHTAALPDYVMEDIRKQDMMDVEFSKNFPLKVNPFHRIFYLDWTLDGKATYWTEGMTEPQITGITRETIDKYYAAVSKGIAETGNLGPRPSDKDLCGNTTYRQCLYCPFSQICDEAEDGDYSNWLDRITQLVKEKGNERWDTMETMAAGTMAGTEVTTAATSVDRREPGVTVVTRETELEILATKTPAISPSEVSSSPKPKTVRSKSSGAASSSRRK